MDVNSSHMTAASGDQPMSITVFVDQSPSGISNDSQSSEHLQKELVKNLRSPDDQEVEIYEGDPSNVEDTTHVWVKEEVELLFKLYKERQKEINDPQKKKREVWIEICEELRRYGYSPTPKQCDRKLRNMKATYIKTLERIKRGDHLSTCQYYDELYDIYGLNPPLQAPPRFLVQNRNRPVPDIKTEYGNGPVNMGSNHLNGSYEPSPKRAAIQTPDQNGSSLKQDTCIDLAHHPNTMQMHREMEQPPLMIERQTHSDHKAFSELLEEMKTLKKALDSEKEAREMERKSFEEERKEFHKERMAMLNSINKLIGNLDQKNS